MKKRYRDKTYFAWNLGWKLLSNLMVLVKTGCASWDR